LNAAVPGSDLVPPRAPRRPTELRAHGDTRVDDYFWLRERDDPEVRVYLEAENAYTTAATAVAAKARDELFAELRAHVQETDVSAPVPDGPWEYYGRTVEGLQYGIQCRRPRGSSGPETVLLDGNALAGDSSYFRIGDAETSPSQQRLAYSVDFNGSERYELRVRDLATGADVDSVPNVYYSVAWGDEETVFYTRPNDAMRPHQLWRHVVGASPEHDALVLQEDDERFEVWVQRSRSDSFVLFGVSSFTTSEVWLIPTSDPTSAPRVVAARREGVEYHVEHRGDELLIWTNDDDATNFALYAARLDDLARDHWRTVVPHDPDVRISQAVAFARFTILYERTNGLERLRVLEGDMTIELPDPVYSVWPGANREFDPSVFRYEYSSLVQPRSAYDYDVAAGTSTLVRRQPVPEYDPEQYVATREWATAADGTSVPISLVRRRDTPLDGTAPLLIYGYGAYEYSIDPAFDVDVLPLLDRGWVYAIAHPRGGGELGRPWYDDGHLRNKINSFTDFIACADHLVASGLVDGRRVAARGASAGGLLMGGVLVLAPERWWKIVAEVPFVDLLSTMSDPSIPLTVNEWEEWGNPADAGDYAAMRVYSPYDNIRAGVRYPAMLVTGGLNDPRVQYWEPAKFVAKLRAVSPQTPVLLKMEMGAGHSGPSGRYDAWRDEAFVLAFLLDDA
jgi:oligopeptidase B